MTSQAWETKGTENENRQNQEWRSNGEQLKEQRNMFK